MDRAPACGAGDTSSIPVRRTIRRRAVLRRGRLLFYTFSTVFFRVNKQNEQQEL